MLFPHSSYLALHVDLHSWEPEFTNTRPIGEPEPGKTIPRDGFPNPVYGNGSGRVHGLLPVHAPAFLHGLLSLGHADCRAPRAFTEVRRPVPGLGIIARFLPRIFSLSFSRTPISNNTIHYVSFPSPVLLPTNLPIGSDRARAQADDRRVFQSLVSRSQ